jgi:hypothetical protein
MHTNQDGWNRNLRLSAGEVLSPAKSRHLRKLGVLALLLLGTFAAAPAAQACTPLERLLGCVAAPPSPLPPDPGGSSDPLVIPGHLAAGKALGYNNTGLPDAEMPKAVALLRSTGASWLRSGVGWKAEKTRNTDPLQRDRQRLDDAYARLDGHMMILILGAPYWAQQPCSNLLDLDCSQSRSVNGQWNYHSPPGDAYIVDYARVARLVAERYPRAIVETWNEPNLGWFWSPDAISPERMARMQCAAYDAVKKQSPTTLVAAPGISWTIGSDLNNSKLHLRHMDWRDYTRRMYVAMGRVCWDVFSVHPYTTSVDLDRAGGGLSQFYADLRAMRSQYGDQSRVFLTEVGWPTSGKDSVTEQQQRDIILRQTAKHLEQPEVDGVFIHTLHNASSNGADPEANFGVFLFDDSPKPAACALGSLILGVTPAGC